MLEVNPLKTTANESDELRLINLYQLFPSLRDTLYPIFEKQYIGRLYQKSYRSEDMLQEQKLTLHLSILTFNIWKSKIPFMLYLAGNTNHTTRYFDKILGYSYWYLRRINQHPIHIAIDQYGADQFILEMADKHPMIDAVIQTEEDLKKSLEFIRENCEHHYILFEFINLGITATNRNKGDNRRIINEMAWKYKGIISEGRNWRKVGIDRGNALIGFVGKEINRMRKINHLMPLPKPFITISKFNSRDRMQRWFQDWYQVHKESQSKYYKARYKRLKKAKR